MNMIAPENHIDCRMKFNACYFCSAKLLHIVDMMNMIVLNDTEYTSHASYNARLFTMVDMTPADNMASYFLFQPSVILTAAHRIPLHLGRTFHMLPCKIMVILRVIVFSEGNTRTLLLLISQSSIIHPFDQCGPTMPS